MKKISVLLAVTALLAGAAQALENAQVATAEAVHAARRVAGPASKGAAPGEAEMQAVCREVLVATDEGYGVTDHVTRFICNETR